MEINSNNFFRWDSNPSDPDPKIVPSPYAPEKCGYPYMPVVVPGEPLSFYINGDTVGGTVGIRDLQDNVVAANIGTAMTVEVSDTVDNAYCETVGPDVPNGFYRLSLGALRSNIVWVKRSGYLDRTCFVRFRNNGRNLFGVRYLDLPDFYHQLRIHIFRIDQQPEYTIEQYRSVSSGRIRDLRGSVDRYVKFQSYYFDRQAHEACEAMLFHSELWINGKQYTFRTGYKSEPLTGSQKSKGEFELWDAAFSELNKC